MPNVDGRTEKELEMLQTRHFLSISEIALSLDVSEMTVRRDVKRLSEKGKLRLVYGGVTSIELDERDPLYTVNGEQGRNTEQKKAIARKAAELLEPNDVVLLDSGTTIQYLAELIDPAFSYTIICYSLNSLNIVTKLPNSTIISPGGIFSQKSLMFSGPEAVGFIRKYRANKAFIAATGYEIKHGLTCGYVEDAPMKQAAMESSVESVLLLDSSKFGKVATCSFAVMEDFDVVISDDGITAEYESNIRKQCDQLVIASCPAPATPIK
jgi:DeoR family transcriptional regulator, deoxyribose operon repressor